MKYSATRNKKYVLQAGIKRTMTRINETTCITSILFFFVWAFSSCVILPEKYQYPVILRQPEKKSYSLTGNQAFHDQRHSNINYQKAIPEKGASSDQNWVKPAVSRKIRQIPVPELTEHIGSRNLTNIPGERGHIIPEQDKTILQESQYQNNTEHPVQQPALNSHNYPTSFKQSRGINTLTFFQLPQYLTLLVAGFTGLGFLVTFTNCLSLFSMRDMNYQGYKRNRGNSFRSHFSKFLLGILFLVLLLLLIGLIIFILLVLSGGLMTASLI